MQGGRTWHCRLQGCIGLTVSVNLARPASCAATALPSCFPPSGNRAASTWRLRSSSADASEDAFLVAAPPELVCLCSSSLKWRGRACGLGSETSASARGEGVSWTYTEWGHCVVVPLEVPGGAGVGREAAPLEQLIWGVSCCKAQVVGLLLVVANDEPSSEAAPPTLHGPTGLLQGSQGRGSPRPRQRHQRRKHVAIIQANTGSEHFRPAGKLPQAKSHCTRALRPQW